jgi:hypothetical protein
VGALVDRLQKQAARLGLTLTRQQALGADGLVERITYAVRGREEQGREEQGREEQGREEQVIYYVTLRKMEGQSTKCEAYIKLSRLKIKLDKISNRR